MGMPKKVIDEKAVADLASRGASNRDIAAVVGCDDKTIASRFSAILAKKRAERHIQIRQAQTEAALAGNATLLIWLGKVELGQVEKPAPQKTEVIVRRVGRNIDGQPGGTPPGAAEDS
jgi:hypothetical protein